MRSLRERARVPGIRRGGSLRELPLDIPVAAGKIFREVEPFTMTSPERVYALYESVRYIERRKIPGAIVECGVWRGGSMMAAAKTLLSLSGATRDLYLFDTFTGMTEPTSADVTFNDERAKNLLKAETKEEGRNVWAWASLGDVRTNMLSSGYPEDRLHFIEGRVEDTIPERAPERIALLRLDTDWYESTAHELLHLVPLMQQGAVLIIDDYGHWRGARKAVDEFLESLDPPVLLHRIDYTARTAVIDRNAFPR